MFYEPKAKNHGLPRDPFKACVVPRPIGWITTLSRDGVINLAPFSYFNAVASDPPIVMYAANGRHLEGDRKDSAMNAEDTGEFVFNLATWDLREAMNATSAHVERDVDEMALAGLEAAPSRLVKPPRVAQSPVAFECTFLRSLDLPSSQPETRNTVVFGEVIGIHIEDRMITDGFVDIAKLKPVARLGYLDYCVVEESFSMKRPD